MRLARFHLLRFVTIKEMIIGMLLLMLKCHELGLNGEELLCSTRQ